MNHQPPEKEEVQDPLQDAVGQRRETPEVELSGEGAYLLGRARGLLELKDDIMRSIRAAPVHGTVRLGLPAELSEHILSRILDRVCMLRLWSRSRLRLQRTMSMKPKNSELDLVVLREGLEPRRWPAGLAEPTEMDHV